MTGICAELRVDGPAVCQIASLSVGSGSISSVSRGRTSAEDGTVTEEFTASGDVEPTQGDEVETEPVFSYEDRTVHRFSRDGNQGCVCELVEQAGCTVRHTEIVDGSIVVTFLTTDLKTIRDVVADLREAHDGVQIRRLTRSNDDDSVNTVVDMNALTCRQKEVLETAYEMGYFEHPKVASAGEVADALHIATPTFTEHLAAAQRKLMDALFDLSERSQSVTPGP